MKKYDKFQCQEIAMADGEHKETLRRGNREKNGNNQITVLQLVGE